MVSSVLSRDSLQPNGSKPFTAEPLTTTFNSDDGKNTPQYIEGRGQRVYWTNCYVTAYEIDDKGNKGEPIEIPEREGEATVQGNIELYFGGVGGKMKEG
jgi:hypothetical protein